VCPSILVVDDEATFLDSVGRMLRIEGYDDCCPVADPTRVPDLLADRSFDVAFLDVTMPGLGGIELLEIIKQRSPQTECVMVTAHDSVPLVIRAMKLGAYDYLVKPITPDDLSHALVRALEHKELLEAQQRQLQLERQVAEAEDERKRTLLAEAERREEVLRRLEVANRELREAQAQLVQSEKIAALGQLVAGISHEMNTPLGAIKSTSETIASALCRLHALLDRDFPGAREDNRELARLLRALGSAATVVESGSDRIAGIVHRLQSFARLDEAEFKQVDVREVIEDALALLQSQLTDAVRVVKDFRGGPLISCCPRQLNHLFLNLLLNAWQAIRGTGEIRVATGTEADLVKVSIQDSGEGIPAEHLDRIFDPGFTTRGVGVGAGLGLAICHRIVKKHGGVIQVQSIVGQGTTVTVTLPSRPA